MGIILRALIRTTAAGTLAGLVTVSGMVLGPLSQSAQGDWLTATTGVNLRSGPGTTYPVVGGLATGQRITALGDSTGGWTPVDLYGKRVFVASRYVTGDTTYRAADSTTGSTTIVGTATTTANLNVRTGPATTYPVATTLGKGTSVSLTGQTSGTWTQISRSGSLYWVSTVYLTTSATAPAPVTTGTATTTTNLNVRSGPSTSYGIITTLARGTAVTTTGTTQDGWTQISLNGSLRWVASSYLSAGSGTSVTLPVAEPVTSTETMYATASVNVRTGPATSYAVVTTLERSQQIGVTGRTSNGWSEVVWQGAQRWVSSQYLTSSQPAPSTVVEPISNSSFLASALVGSVGLGTTVPAITPIVNTVESRWPVVGPYYGTRIEPGSDHNDGRAVDMMIPNWSTTNKPTGDAIAAYLQANAQQYDVSYIIWRQHIWSVARASEGWRPMADRGSYTANHYDHVHVSVN
ncbi:Uncharacterized conserved protein YgiM, contains N-terminal SH3 domain, DUF1202 family [Raineyella antarctica]|uniref:Uncharacterized conserved protein YgiM, contains N-terminal SH3 domain, DUF1202 family n=1 Tax=Raineyella antarctica TaxID=1577474 RepID=A0A1G6GG57_9ACTN|nr:SH3 domain-containing protein [Raineyella antarctica]SDB80735.1 Uncharacterized conserved protein YgiM, contains N-terminal SH3 domain, DUF1202 family [Raineyella antarctica]